MICHLELKPGVRLHATVPEIIFATEVVRGVWEEWGASACVVTAGVDGKHEALGEHYKGAALDFRTTTIPVPSAELEGTTEETRRRRVEKAVIEVARRLGAVYLATDDHKMKMYQGANFFLYLENLGDPNEHLHISYRPQAFGV